MIDERNEEATEEKRLATRITGEVREHLSGSRISAAVKNWRRHSVLFIGDFETSYFSTYDIPAYRYYHYNSKLNSAIDICQ